MSCSVHLGCNDAQCHAEAAGSPVVLVLLLTIEGAVQLIKFSASACSSSLHLACTACLLGSSCAAQAAPHIAHRVANMRRYTGNAPCLLLGCRHQRSASLAHDFSTWKKARVGVLQLWCNKAWSSFQDSLELFSGLL